MLVRIDERALHSAHDKLYYDGVVVPVEPDYEAAKHVYGQRSGKEPWEAVIERAVDAALKEGT